MQYDYRKDFSNEVDNFHKSLSIDTGATCSHKFILQRIDPALIKGFCLGAVFIQNSSDNNFINEVDANINIENTKFWKIAFDFDEEFSYELCLFLFSITKYFCFCQRYFWKK